MVQFIVCGLIIFLQSNSVVLEETGLSDSTSIESGDDYKSKILQLENTSLQLQLNISELRHQLNISEFMNGVLHYNISVLEKTVKFYECCCSTLFFGSALEKIEKNYWFRTEKKGLEFESKSESGYSTRYQNCMEFFISQKRTDFPENKSEDSIEEKMAKRFYERMQTFFDAYSKNNSIELNETIRRFCFSDWKSDLVRNSVIDEMLTIMSKKRGIRKSFDKMACFPYFTPDKGHRINETDIFFINFAHSILDGGDTAISFELRPISDNSSDTAVITDACIDTH